MRVTRLFESFYFIQSLKCLADPTYISYTDQLSIPIDDYGNYSADQLRWFIASFVGNSATFGNQTKTANDLLWFEYVTRFEDVDVVINSTFYLQQYVNVSDVDANI